MSAIHILKIWPEPFAAIKSGEKTYEIRKNDRNFQVGDSLLLEEWDPITEMWSNHWVIAEITYMNQGEWGLPSDLCVMALKVANTSAQLSINCATMEAMLGVSGSTQDYEQAVA